MQKLDPEIRRLVGEIYPMVEAGDKKGAFQHARSVLGNKAQALLMVKAVARFMKIKPMVEMMMLESDNMPISNVVGEA